MGKVVLVTPYSGWSHGIYYTKPDDALAPDEQALVIADVDPIYMNEGKPRPQALPVPLQLVAHLPIIETIDCDVSLTNVAQIFQEDMVGCNVAQIIDSSVVADIAESLSQQIFVSGSAALDPNARDPKTGKTAIELGRHLVTASKNAKSFGKRLDVWSHDWNEMPFYGAPPTLLDWLWVDMTLAGPLPNILVPPWTRDDGSADSRDELKDLR